MTFGPTSSALDCFVIFDWFFEKLFKLKFGYEDGKSHGSRERGLLFCAHHLAVHQQLCITTSKICGSVPS